MSDTVLHSRLLPYDIQARVLTGVIEAYRVPSGRRFYHVFRHALDVLDRLERVFEMKPDLFQRPKELGLAALYHDIVYVPGSAENELLSAQRALRDMQPFVPFVDAGRVAQLILYTAMHGRLTHDMLRDDVEAQLLLDADMLGFAMTDEGFAQNNHDIDREFDYLPRDTYFAARDKFLKSLLAKPSIFLSDHYNRGGFGEVARRNIEREIQRCALERP